MLGQTFLCVCVSVSLCVVCVGVCVGQCFASVIECLLLLISQVVIVSYPFPSIFIRFLVSIKCRVIHFEKVIISMNIIGPPIYIV